MILWPAILLGLAASLHCVAMCGPIALALPLGGAKGFARVVLVLTYNLGRAISYALLGLFAAVFGSAIALGGWQQGLSILAGTLVILVGLFPLVARSRSLTLPFTWLRNKMRQLFVKRKRLDLFLIGLLNGLLPCGMVYVALAAAFATGKPLSGALFMFLYGTGTFPLMAALPFLPAALPNVLRIRSRRVLPVMSCLVGALLVLRGLSLGVPYLSPASSDVATGSCHSSSIPAKSAHLICKVQPTD